MNESNNYPSKYVKQTATAISGGLAGFAAIDQALQGDKTILEIIAENGETIDRIDHHALGIFGSLNTEKAYNKLSNGDNGGGKYLVMMIGGAAAGGLGEAAKHTIPYIPGQPELKGIYDGAKGALPPTIYQIGADSHNKTEYQTKDTEQAE